MDESYAALRRAKRRAAAPASESAPRSAASGVELAVFGSWRLGLGAGAGAGAGAGEAAGAGAGAASAIFISSCRSSTAGAGAGAGAGGGGGVDAAIVDAAGADVCLMVISLALPP
jgi:hypothetical protein